MPMQGKLIELNSLRKCRLINARWIGSLLVGGFVVIFCISLFERDSPSWHLYSGGWQVRVVSVLACIWLLAVFGSVVLCARRINGAEERVSSALLDTSTSNLLDLMRKSDIFGKRLIIEELRLRAGFAGDHLAEAWIRSETTEGIPGRNSRARMVREKKAMSPLLVPISVFTLICTLLALTDFSLNLRVAAGQTVSSAIPPWLAGASMLGMLIGLIAMAAIAAVAAGDRPKSSPPFHQMKESDLIDHWIVAKDRRNRFIETVIRFRSSQGEAAMIGLAERLALTDDISFREIFGRKQGPND